MPPPDDRRGRAGLCRVDSPAEQRSSRDVVWHGGEPTATPIGLFRGPAGPVRGAAARGDGASRDPKTNATLINRQWCELFTAYGFEVGVSIEDRAR
ncbi:hypothetical protein [Salinispora arenicola]|uniref:hypothetical protein n=1 Tax=Salinispora arenicola TaxID=168697 RepID=UPI0034669A48